jgi:hypothetical protein
MGERDAVRELHALLHDHGEPLTAGDIVLHLDLSEEEGDALLDQQVARDRLQVHFGTAGQPDRYTSRLVLAPPVRSSPRPRRLARAVWAALLLLGGAALMWGLQAATGPVAIVAPSPAVEHAELIAAHASVDDLKAQHADLVARIQRLDTSSERCARGWDAGEACYIEGRLMTREDVGVDRARLEAARAEVARTLARVGVEVRP